MGVLYAVLVAWATVSIVAAITVRWWGPWIYMLSDKKMHPWAYTTAAVVLAPIVIVAFSWMAYLAIVSQKSEAWDKVLGDYLTPQPGPEIDLSEERPPF